MKSQKYAAAILLSFSVLLAGCATEDMAGADPGDLPNAGDGHGAISGATEVAEAPLHLATIDDHGAVGLLDLLSEQETGLEAVNAAQGLASEGRYLFVPTPQELNIIDSGMWSWNHSDHFHYYRETPRVIGTLEHPGPVVLSGGSQSNAGSTGVYFPETGTGMLLENARLAEGEISVLLTTNSVPHQGVLAPIGQGALASKPAAEGAAATVQYLDVHGEPVAGTQASCAEPTAAIATVAGVAIGCAEGILVARSEENDRVDLSMIRYPEGTEANDRVGELAQRKSRPSVAGAAGSSGAWLLNARTLELQRIMTGEKLLYASAVGDAQEHVIALDTRGRVLAYSAKTGEIIGKTKPLLPQTLNDPQAMQGVQLSVDAQRAYLNAPKEQLIYEIDFADNARISRTLHPETAPSWMAQVGQ